MNKTPKISVIIPVYNAEKYLRQCLDSVINQTLQDIEIICVDDGSTDNSLNILQEYKKNDSRLYIICQQNQYAGVARNNGMARAKGEYLLFLDADDFFELSMLEKLYRKITLYDADIVMCEANMYDSISKKFSPMSWVLEKMYLPRQDVFNSSDIPNHIFQLTVGVPWNILFKKSFIDKLGIKFLSTQRANDIYFIFVSLALANSITVIKEELVHYRINTGTNLQSAKEKSPTDFLQGLTGIKNQLIKHNKYLELKRSFINRVMTASMHTFSTIKQSAQAYQILFDLFMTKYLVEFDLLNKPKDYFYNKTYYKIFETLLQEIIQTKMTENQFDKPEFSIIIPVYNSEMYLRDCLDSILEQSFKYFEVICVDDGSTDNSRKILMEYAKKDNRVKVICQKNQYAGVARNNGIAHSQGDYIVFLDSDDLLTNNALKDFYGSILFYKPDIIVAGTCIFSDDVRKAKKTDDWLNINYIPSNDAFSAETITPYIFNFTVAGPGGKCFRRVFIEQNSLRFLSLPKSEDFYFIQLGLAKSKVIAVVRNPVYYIRNVPNSLEHRKDEMPLLFWDAILLLKEKLIEENLYEQVKQSYINANINRFAYNLKSMKTVEGQEAILKKLRAVYESELGLSVFPQSYYYNQNNYVYLCKKLAIEYKVIEKPKVSNNLQQDYYIKEIEQIRSSASYRIGRFVTYIPRKVRGGIRCYKEHGMGYTMRRVKEKFVGLLGGIKTR